MASMSTIKCKTCNKEKSVRVADLNRGWGLYCSKRCKAIKQEARTRQYSKFLDKTSKKSNRDTSSTSTILSIINRHINRVDSGYLDPGDEDGGLIYDAHLFSNEDDGEI